ncbi:OLC1v1022700C1 [Oldenlandia corymbosa var. corymbosa]|uniref:OLC1v1022700C1 n=1 Tax=Oldenlandia corymbosa var. corymbosa TaxID=529605 RepID=A0AAV1BYH1_OLDCO|nr:OLC1v1022700C1 [Oldenlandia corymbosa var. corymbosa]
MEKYNDWNLNPSLRELRLNVSKAEKSTKIPAFSSSSLQSSLIKFKQPKPLSLLSLCLGVVGRHLEDIIEDLPEISPTLPSNIKMVIAAIARRRKLLNDDAIVSLAESSWDMLDVSGSDISDSGLSQLVKMCTSVRAMDISQCRKLTPTGVAELLENCNSLEVLRWGGCPASEETARRCSRMLKPNFRDVVRESWEDLDIEIAPVAQSLRWLVWPKIDKDSLEILSMECPRIVVNPKLSPFGYRGVEVPREALPNVVLDDPVVDDIDPKTWAVSGFEARSRVPLTSGYDELPLAEKFRRAFLERDTRLAPKRAKNERQHQRRAEGEWTLTSGYDELPLAEKFRRAFLERDTRLAPKRAKNARQHQRRAAREWVSMSSRAKSMALASQVTKSMYH